VLSKSKVQFILDTKLLRNPKEFCMNISPSVSSSNSSDKKRNREAGEGSSQQDIVPLNYNGVFIVCYITSTGIIELI